MATESLSPADRSSLQAERGPVKMSVAGALIFEQGSYDAVAERLAQRIHLVPRYRQRLEEAPFGISGPVWVDDESFDLHWHLHHGTLPAPGNREQVAAYVAKMMSRKLDRSRPLWELHVVEGLEGARVAVIPKMHHALVDGMAAVGIGMVLLDPTREPMAIEPPAEDWQPRTVDRRRQLMGLAAQPIARAQKMMLEGAVRALDTSPRRAAGDVFKATELMTELARQRPQAPMTPLNEPLTPNRRYATRSARLADIKAAGKATGGTVNDVVLAVVTGMLRRYLKAAGTDLGGKDPVALVPVSIRREEEEDTGGNRISMVFADLPVHEDDPAEVVHRIHNQMRNLRASAAVRAGAIMVGATGQVPPVVASMLVRAMGNVRAFNLVVSNVPGPQMPFYMNGARLLEAYPAVPLNPANQRLSVGILSYDGGVYFGLHADAALEPRVEVAAEALDLALAEVLSLTTP